MSDLAIRVEGLGKEFRIGSVQENYRTLRDSITDVFSAPFARAYKLLHGQSYAAAGLEERIWALRDVSFEVKYGQVVGIIGRNGAGKSTLLKVLSRITEPTEGFVEVFGRVGALLEVGTGFHPELTGRENIYLNGAILGMSRKEIASKFDEIVAFAEVERFIDTPVKHYSSGMGLRLGFAVAAHLEPEILIVDEVLAVGDASFQKKCLGKMSEVAGEGRTVLFVSHNMDAVKRLCLRAIILDSGTISMDGEVTESVDFYLHDHEVGPNIVNFDLDETKEAQFISITVRNNTGSTSYFHQDEAIHIEGNILFRQKIHACMIAIALYTADGVAVMTTIDWDSAPDRRFQNRGPGEEQFRVTIPARFLFPGRYFLRLGLGISGHYTYDAHQSPIEFDVTYDGSLMFEFGDKRRGLVTPILEWEIKES